MLPVMKDAAKSGACVDIDAGPVKLYFSSEAVKLFSEYEGELILLIRNLSEEEEEAEKVAPTSEIDQMITTQSDEAQAQFLKGGIPKVVYKHAMTECKDPQLALTFLQISFELNNNFVEKFILDDVLEQYGNVRLLDCSDV